MMPLMSRSQLFSNPKLPKHHISNLSATFRCLGEAFPFRLYRAAAAPHTGCGSQCSREFPDSSTSLCRSFPLRGLCLQYRTGPHKGSVPTSRCCNTTGGASAAGPFASPGLGGLGCNDCVWNAKCSLGAGADGNAAGFPPGECTWQRAMTP